MDSAQGDMNEWPIDERFVDYTSDSALGGIINDTTDYPEKLPSASSDPMSCSNRSVNG